MSRQPLSSERICEALESCRPGSSDLYAPDFADVADQISVNPQLKEIYERIQNADLKISTAFHDVEIPAGLEQRLVALLELAQAEDACSAALKGDADMVSPSVSLAVPFHKNDHVVSRRWLIMAGGMLATTAAIFLMLYLGMNHTDGYSQQTVLDEAIHYFDADFPSTQGQLLTETSPPSEFPFSKALRPLRGIRWRAVKNFMGQSGVAFDLPTHGGTRATLYAVNLSAKSIAKSPSLKPSFTTGGCYTTVWRENGLLYVLVVRGNRQSYQQFLTLPTGPLA